jgi:hypothetical protein
LKIRLLGSSGVMKQNTKACKPFTLNAYGEGKVGNIGIKKEKLERQV